MEDWAFAEKIREAERLIRHVTSDPKVTPQKRDWCDQAHRFQRPPSKQGVTPQRSTTDKDSSEATHPVPWLVLALGLGVFVCGAALIALSLINQNPQLWQLGLPMVLGGQVAVLAVVIWQFEAVCHSNRATFVALHAMDDRLRQLQNEWLHLQQRLEVEEQPFYRHLAEGADPAVLLADLKDQIDVLSHHLGQANRAA